MTIDEAVQWLHKFLVWGVRDRPVLKAGMQILQAHLDDNGDEFFAALKQYRISKIDEEIAVLEAERADLQS